ncbi:crotonase/enoyl-CoA hydratase family protein [Verticiella sediminum]|uniref:Crotonase/enoyl-CoA hydratase family protein n=1 Tax=Verticiella sediminum TaxID=1247510 RepID=A0A556B098_9BURK|nr:crotonase/enoyl-CoA hydratase family protein [Verticiella sediminum]TSH98611.1 crotonase/enoyl-CoA hydratase family protein [Verticiella sediminum]
MSSFLAIERRDNSVVVLTLNRPETRNALSGEDAINEIVDTLHTLGHDETTRAIVLTGAGSAFCAGGDLASLQALSETPGMKVRSRYRGGIQRIPLAFERLDVPVIAAVNGPAVGAGCDLACMCDIRIASTQARFAESFIRLGIIPGDGGAWFLPRAIALSHAYQMALTGETIDAEQALRWGLVSEVVEPDQLLARALRLADLMAANPLHALRLTKRLIREGQHARLDSLLEMSAAYQALAHQTDEHRGAVAGMRAKVSGRKA